MQLQITNTKTADNQTQTSSAALTCDQEGDQHQSEKHLLGVHAALLHPPTVAAPTEQVS